MSQGQLSRELVRCILNESRKIALYVPCCHFLCVSRMKRFCKAECDDSTAPLVPEKHAVFSFLIDQLANVTLLLQKRQRKDTVNYDF